MQFGLITAQAAAIQLGVDRSTITRDAKTHSIGRFVGNQKLFSASDVRKLKGIRSLKRKCGNSNKKTIA
jgi:hypothetical protein